MPLTISLTPGYTLSGNETLTNTKLNLLGNPTVSLEGDISTTTIADGAVTTAKLADSVLTADATGRAKMVDGFVTADKLASDAVTTAKILNAQVSAAKLDNSARGGVHQYAAGTLGTGVYAVTLSPAATAYTTGLRIAFKADTANSGAVDVNVNSLGAKDLKLAIAGGTKELGANELVAGQIVEAIYDGTQFLLLGRAPGQYVGSATALATTISQAHGLGAMPRTMRWVLVCDTIDCNYAVGDEVAVEAVSRLASAGSQYVPAFSTGANATNVFLAKSPLLGGDSYYIADKSDGTNSAMTIARWTAKCYASL